MRNCLFLDGQQESDRSDEEMEIEPTEIVQGTTRQKTETEAG